MVAERTGFLQLSQRGEEAETDYLVRLRNAAHYCKFADLKASLHPEAEMIRIQFIAGLRDSESNLKSLETFRANNNLTVEQLFLLIQYRTQAKRFAESAVHQSISSVVAYAEKCDPKNNKDLTRRRKPEQFGRKPFHPLYEYHNCSKRGHYSGMCKAKRQEASRTEGKTYRKSNESVYNTCEYQEFEDTSSSKETL